MLDIGAWSFYQLVISSADKIIFYERKEATLGEMLGTC
jgi:hypothetical protein